MGERWRWAAPDRAPHGWRYPIAAIGIGVALGLTVDVLDARSTRAELSIVRDRPDLDPRIKTVVLDPRDDQGKAGAVRGVMGWRLFEIPAGSSGPSPKQLRFRFAAPAEILQIDISVDIGDPRANLVEFAAAINARDGYGLDRRADWLMHASWTRTSSSHGALDETTRLPPGVRVAPGDFLAISAWLGGEGIGSPIRVSPEVVVLYRWRLAFDDR